MKKILSILLTLVILIIPSNIIAKSDDLSNTEIVVQEILNNKNISKETKEWLGWFNNLSAKDQQYINYRPLELSKYNYEKNTLKTHIIITMNFLIYILEHIAMIVYYQWGKFIKI